jgi:hypothetical protein
MGTSSAFGGARGTTPLVPSWLDDGGGTAPPVTSPPGPQPAPPTVPPGGTAAPATVAPATTATPSAGSTAGSADRFTAARSNLSRFVRSGGSDRRSLGRAVSSYVSRSTGGSSNAARRMGSSRTSASRLVGFLNQAQTEGVREALRSLNLDGLAGQPIENVFAGLADYICPEGGSIDEGIARDAFIETIADLAGAGITDIDGLTPAQVQTVFELYATHAIEARICNDIGTRLITLPADIRTAERVQAQLRDFIRRSVADALAASNQNIQALTPDRVSDFVTAIYRSSFEVLQILGDAEANQ